MRQCVMYLNLNILQYIQVLELTILKHIFIMGFMKRLGCD